MIWTPGNEKKIGARHRLYDYEDEYEIEDEERRMKMRNDE